MVLYFFRADSMSRWLIDGIGCWEGVVRPGVSDGGVETGERAMPRRRARGMRRKHSRVGRG